MKKLLCFLFATGVTFVVAQPKKDPKMAATTSPGYYVVAKGDTIKGEVRNNPEDVTEFYRSFWFKPAKGGKLTVISTKKAKAYGFDDRNFVLVMDKDAEVYVEVLARGRLNFFEFKYNGEIEGLPAIESGYFVQDNMAEGEDVKLKELKKLNQKFYKKEMKPYMKEQPMIWADLDKFTFNKQTLTSAIIEFNKFYTIKGSN